MRPLRRNPKGRGFPGDLRCRAARPWGLPRASRRFAHLIPESLRRGHAGLIQRFLSLPARMSIVENRKAYHDYFVEEKFEAGLALEGWEVKAIRAGRAQLKEAYVVVRKGEIVLLGAHVTPLPTASTHIHPDPTRTRKLLLHRAEINRLIGKVERAGYTMTPLDLHFKQGRIKLEIGLAKGKKQYDKRETEKLRDWNREKQRLLRDRTGSARAGRSK